MHTLLYRLYKDEIKRDREKAADRFRASQEEFDRKAHRTFMISFVVAIVGFVAFSSRYGGEAASVAFLCALVAAFTGYFSGEAEGSKKVHQLEYYAALNSIDAPPSDDA